MTAAELKREILRLLAEDPEVRAAVRDVADLLASDDDAVEPDTRTPLSTEPLRVQIIEAEPIRVDRQGRPVPPWVARKGQGPGKPFVGIMIHETKGHGTEKTP
jgi:hypothetical protein